jgi:serine protease Do
MGYVIAAVVGGLVVVAAFAIGAASGDPEPAPTSTIPVAATTSSTTVATSTNAPTTTASRVPSSVPLTVIDGTVADVAAAVAPAVVQIETLDSVGSGVIWRADGYIITAAHVLLDPTADVTVRLADGRQLVGEIVGVNAPIDIAVVKIDADGLIVAELALRRPLEIGEPAIALGSPFGFDQTVTSGIVSAVDRLVDGVAMVQTDAAINPGNSGGPLLDHSGAVIGINDVIFSQTGSSDGVGFAIAIDLAATVAEQLVAGGDVEVAFLGVFVSGEVGDFPGALISEVEADSPADLAGMLAGDIVITFDGEIVTNRDALGAKILRRKPAEVVGVEIFREGTFLDLDVELGATGR